MNKSSNWMVRVLLIGSLVAVLPSCGGTGATETAQTETAQTGKEIEPVDLTGSEAPGKVAEIDPEKLSERRTESAEPAQLPAESRVQVRMQDGANRRVEASKKAVPHSNTERQHQTGAKQTSGTVIPSNAPFEPEPGLAEAVDVLETEPVEAKDEVEFPAEIERRPPPVVEPVVVPSPPRRAESGPAVVSGERTRVPVPAVPAPPDPVILPAGTAISVRLDEEISSEFNRSGDTYRATLDEDLLVDGDVVIPKGTVVIGEILSVVEPGKVKGRASISFALHSIRLGEEELSVQTSQVTMEAESTKSRDTAKVGAVTAIGAVLGGIFGGKKGAAIGAATGAGAGTAGVLLSKGQHIRIEKERLFSFRLEQDVELYR